MLPWVVLSDAVTGDVVAEVRGRGAEVSDGNTYRLGLRGYVRPRVEWMDAWGRVIVSSRRGWFSATPLEIEAEGRDWVALALLEFGICQLRRPLW